MAPAGGRWMPRRARHVGGRTRVLVMARRIEGILFDLGDTLLDFGELDVRALFESGARLAYEYLKSLGQPLPAFSRYHLMQLWSVRWNYFKSRITRREFNAMDIMGRLSRRMGHRLSDDQLLELAWRWYQPLSNVATVESGLRELLLRFQSRRLVMGLVSNTFVPGEVLDRHLQRENLLDLLPFRVYSCDARYRKPDGRIFAMALERSGLEPGQTLFVGDSIQADIHGANQAGLISVLKDPAGRYDHAGIKPAHRIHKLAEIDGILDQYGA